MESSYPQAARGWVGFNVPMSHKITAAADLLLMPSRFEPCGLNQLYAMAYGTVPVAHATGGLRDTVLPFDPWKGARACSRLAAGPLRRANQCVARFVLGAWYRVSGTYRSRSGCLQCH